MFSSAIHKAAGLTDPGHSMISTGTITMEQKSVHWLSMVAASRNGLWGAFRPPAFWERPVTKEPAALWIALFVGTVCMSASAYVIHPDRFISATPRPTVPPVAQATAPLAYYTMFDAHTSGCWGGGGWGRKGGVTWKLLVQTEHRSVSSLWLVTLTTESKRRLFSQYFVDVSLLRVLRSVHTWRQC